MDHITGSETATDSQPQDETLNAEEDRSNKVTISVQIIDNNGDIAVLSNITSDVKVSALMKKSFIMFFKNDKKSIFQYNVILIRTGKILARFKTVEENDLKNNDELLLVERYVMEDDAFTETVRENLKVISTSRNSKSLTDRSQVPNQAIIDEVTKKMKTKNKKKKKIPNYKSPYCNDALIQIELNSVFLSLIEMSANLLCFHDVNAIYKDIITKLGLDMKLDRIRLRQIIDMGYDMDISKIALSLKKNNVKEAVQWLTTQSPSITPGDIAEFVNLNVGFEKIEVNSKNFSVIIKMIANYLLKRQEFGEVWEENVKRIEKVGFKELEIRRALRKSFNEPNRACLFLLEEPMNYDSKPSDNDSICTIVMDKLLQDPEILLALSDRNMIIAMLDLVDYPDNHIYLTEGSRIDDLLRMVIEAFETEKHYVHGCRDIIPPPFTIMYDSDI